MKNPIGICLAIVAMLFLATIALCCISFTKHADAALDATRDTITAVKVPTQKLEATWAATGLTAAQTLAKERDAFAAQSKQATDVGAASVKFFSAATETIKGVNQSQKRIADSIVTSAAVVTKSITDTTGATAASIESLTDRSNRLLDAATAQVSNPQIAETIGHIDTVSENVADTTKHLDATAGNIEDTTGELKEYVHQMLHPTSLKQFLQALEQSIFLGIKIAF